MEYAIFLIAVMVFAIAIGIWDEVETRKELKDK
jgi:hypothetical protein